MKSSSKVLGKGVKGNNIFDSMNQRSQNNLPRISKRSRGKAGVGSRGVKKNKQASPREEQRLPKIGNQAQEEARQTTEPEVAQAPQPVQVQTQPVQQGMDALDTQQRELEEDEELMMPEDKKNNIQEKVIEKNFASVLQNHPTLRGHCLAMQIPTTKESIYGNDYKDSISRVSKPIKGPANDRSQAFRPNNKHFSLSSTYLVSLRLRFKG